MSKKILVCCMCHQPVDCQIPFDVDNCEIEETVRPCPVCEQETEETNEED